MNFQRLRILREVASRGSVTAAADVLLMTPSAVSQQLRVLERETKLVLVEPQGRGIRLTDAGLSLTEQAQIVLTAVERAEAVVERYREGVVGRIRIAIFPTFAQLLLPGLLHRVADTPGLTVECRVIEVDASTVADLSIDYEIVVAHRDEAAPPFEDARVEVTPLLREPVDVVLPVGHRLAKRRRIALQDLAGEPFISMDERFTLDKLLVSLSRHTGVRPQILQRINRFRVIEALVADGHGVALLPRFTVEDRGGRRLVRRPLSGFSPARQIDVLVRAGAADRPSVRVVLDALRAEAKALSSR